MHLVVSFPPFHANEKYVNVHLPALDEWITFPACDEMVCHDCAIHPWDGDLERRIRVLKLPPADVLKPTDKNDTDIHPDAAVKVKTRATQKICTVGAGIGTVHGALDEGFREQSCRDPVECIVWRAGNIVEDTDGPRRAA